jgi:hypothetical protein
MLIFHISSVNFNFIEKYLIIINHNLISYVFFKKRELSARNLINNL